MLRLHTLQPLGLGPVNLTLQDGGCLAVTGPSGAGKTLFLRAIADLDENGGDAETATLRRADVAGPVWRRAVAYVPAESGWWADTVAGHMPASEQCLSLMAGLGLPAACLDWEVARLSTGEKQRLALIRALLSGPEVLLLDEPTSALDAGSTDAVEQVLKKCLDAGATLVIVTHNVEQAKRFNALEAVVRDGTVTIGSDGRGA